MGNGNNIHFNVYLLLTSGEQKSFMCLGYLYFIFYKLHFHCFPYFSIEEHLYCLLDYKISLYIKIFLSQSVKYIIGILIGIVLSLQIALGGMDIFRMLILLIHEHSVCFHLFVSSSVSFFSVL